ncbi:hypothetical protein [Demequina sp. NBRC 110051]|uniref:hypothetical protein n=1 Tax=Demequina sp. NBRC 110051 TaxID=1570340 RepID=UPI000A069D08|nr:hypothetical protein [Demequina sp. NBRC 110051]
MSPTTQSPASQRSQTTTVGISSAAVGAVLALVGTWAIGGAASADDLITASSADSVAQQAATSREAVTVQGVRYTPGVCVPDDGTTADSSSGADAMAGSRTTGTAGSGGSEGASGSDGASARGADGAGGTGGNDTGDSAVEAEVTSPAVGGVVEDTTDAVGEVLDGVSDGVKDTTEELEDTVVDVVPEGPLRDTVKPIIDAVNVSGLVAWLLDSLLCATDSAVSVTASDNVGVEDVTLAIGVAGSTLVDVDLAPSGGNTWTGAVSPLSALDLGLLNRVVSVEVTAVDAAGNTATTVTQKTVEILSCLG